jgi:hypothetical protein
MRSACSRRRMTPIDQIDTIVSGIETTKLNDEIATRALTLVKNGNGTIPLDRTKRIAVLGISNGFDGPLTMASLNGSLRAAGVRFTPAYIQENSTPEQIEAARQAVSGGRCRCCRSIWPGAFGCQEQRWNSRRRCRDPQEFDRCPKNRHRRQFR